jgi:hypothetical protein
MLIDNIIDSKQQRPPHLPDSNILSSIIRRYDHVNVMVRINTNTVSKVLAPIPERLIDNKYMENMQVLLRYR